MLPLGMPVLFYVTISTDPNFGKIHSWDDRSEDNTSSGEIKSQPKIQVEPELQVKPVATKTKTGPKVGFPSKQTQKGLFCCIIVG